MFGDFAEFMVFYSDFLVAHSAAQIFLLRTGASPEF